MIFPSSKLVCAHSKKPEDLKYLGKEKGHESHNIYELVITLILK